MLLALAACGGDGAASPDAGLMAPVAKDAAAELDAGEPSGDDAAATFDASAPDAAAPDAAVPLPDRDGDGLPDERDPAPDAPNRILFADDFGAPSPRWLLTSSAMRAESGAMRVDELDGVVREAWLGPQTSWTDLLVELPLSVAAVGRSSEAGAGRAGVMLRVLQIVPDRYITCGVDARRGTVFLSEHDGGNSAGRVLAQAPLPTALGAHQLSASVRGTRFVCRVDGVEVTITSTLYVSGSVGLRTQDVVFAADAISVYAL